MICVCSHDAGGAEVVSSYVRQEKLDCVYSLEGPALPIFERKLGRITTMPIDQAINKSDWLLCSTSWQSELEWRAIGFARTKGIRSVAFLDHWVHYQERFIRHGERHLPDEIWVGDEMAEALATQPFPQIPVKLVINPYFGDLLNELGHHKNHLCVHDRNKINVLYVCEPIREHALLVHGDERYWGYTEEEALRYFLQKVDILERPINRIVIRPHPSEPKGKYDWVKSEFDLPIAPGNSKSLLDEITESDIVVGCESMALVVGLLANKRVMSCIPPGGKTCSLPQPEIERLAR